MMNFKVKTTTGTEYTFTTDSVDDFLGAVYESDEAAVQDEDGNYIVDADIIEILKNEFPELVKRAK